MMRKELVRINKEMNLNRVEIEEGFQNLYVNIIHEVNGMEKYSPIKLTKKDLIKLLGANSRNTKYLHDILLKLTSSNEIEVGDKKFYGSIFSVKKEKIENGEDETYTIYVNDPYKELMFTKSDIDLMHKVKKYKHLPMTQQEAEYWHNSLKEKKKFLMILNNNSIKALRGKNNKIIYSMLKEFSGSTIESGEHKDQCYRKISYKEFKEALQLPETCRNDNLDRAVMKAKNDITEKTELTIAEIIKYPLKPGVKKEYMIIYFYEKELYRKARLKNEKLDDVIELSEEAISDIEAKKETDLKKGSDIPPEVEKLKTLIKKQIKNHPDFFEIWGNLVPMCTEDEVYRYIAEKELIINFELIETPEEE